MRIKNCLFYILLILAIATPVLSQDVYLKLTTGTTRKMVLAVANFSARGGSAYGGKAPLMFSKVAPLMKDIIYNDLNFSLYFNMLKPDTELSPTDFAGWGDVGVSTLVTGDFILGKDTVINIQVSDVFNRRKIFNKSYDLGTSSGLAIDKLLRKTSHSISDDIILALTGEKGISQTKILFSVKRGSAKELAIVDYDGNDFRQVTKAGSLSLFPSWGPENKSVAFSSYRGSNLYVFSCDILTSNITSLSAYAGMNTTPAYSPDGKKLALTLTKDGNSEIYVLEDKMLRRITINDAIDTSPSWSPNGREIAFVSDRAGSPQIYMMAEDGTNVRRLTYSGDYNTSPTWSPKGDRIAYVSREPNQLLQVYTISINGENNSPLTWRGDNENPSWSPDGLHICFTSNRDGPEELFVMHWDGSGQVPIATLYDGIFAPSWSSY